MRSFINQCSHFPLKFFFTLCNSVDGPGENYAKGNKPVRERLVPYDFTHMWNLMNKINQQAK